MADVRKGTFRNKKDENKRHKISNMVLNTNVDYASGKKNKYENKNKQKGKENELKKSNICFIWEYTGSVL